MASGEARRRTTPYARPSDRSLSIDVGNSCDLDIEELPAAEPFAARRTRSHDGAMVAPMSLRRSGVSDLVSEMSMLPDVPLAPLPLLRSEPLAAAPVASV